MNKNFKKIIVTISIILAFLITLGVGFFIGRESLPSIEKITGLTNKELGKPQDLDFSLFWDAWDLLEEKSASREELSRQEMIYGAITGMIKSLGDPYTVFMDPEDSHRFLEDIKGSFEGIGAEIGIKEGVLTVIAPLEGTPAQKAGLKSGDKIIKVDDTLTAELTLDEAVNLIRGPKGSKVILTIDRTKQTKEDRTKETKEIEIIRGVIDIPEVKWELNQDDIAYVDIFHFSDEVSQEFSKAAVEILTSNPQGIVLDLRNNPGGYLERAVDIAGWFLERGEIVAIEDFGSGEKKEYRAHGNARLKDFPLVVLINEGSASGSEILAGALRDNRKVKLIGQTSFGKGSVQQLEELKGGSSLKITVARWLTPNGVSITEQGLEPDIKVELTEEDFNNDRDPQLEEAIKILR